MTKKLYKNLTMSTTQLNSNELRIVLDVLNHSTDNTTKISIAEMFLHQEHLSCKIILLGDDYVKRALESFRRTRKLKSEFLELRRLNRSRMCCGYFDNRDGKLKTITVEGVTRTLVFNNIEKFSVLDGRFFDRAGLMEFLRVRYSYRFYIEIVGSTVKCSEVRYYKGRKLNSAPKYAENFSVGIH